MGTWGTGPFENDDAMDWLALLEPSSNLDDCVTAIENDPYGQVAIAGAECLAAAAARPGGPHPEPVLAWIERLRQKPTAQTLARVADRIEALTEPTSDLAEDWAETDDADNWQVVIQDLVRRLRNA